jgi:hypothetical protein
MANDDRMSTRVLMTAQTKGIQVDISKYPAWYTPPNLQIVSMLFPFCLLFAVNLQSTNNCTAQQCLNPTNHHKDRWRNPYQFPAAPLYYACPERNDEVDAADEQ